MKCRLLFILHVIALSACAAPQAQPAGQPQPPSQTVPASRPRTPLVAATMSMVAAAEVPENPLTDATLDKSPIGHDIRWGFRLFTNTPVEAERYVPGKVVCSNCHLNAGQRDRALPVVGIAGMFPEYNKRAGRPISLTDRVLACFMRSENATAKEVPTATSPEVIALTAYLTWLSRGYSIGASPQWRGQNTIPTAAQIPIARLDPHKGEALFTERCAACHGVDGQGILVGDRRPAPLWGPDSWNDGAGAARVYTLAGIIRYTMPYVTPGSLTDEEAQQVAAFITSQPRPAYPFKERDYAGSKVPADAVYYRAQR
jgi:thiosulfate dehydrogenase